MGECSVSLKRLLSNDKLSKILLNEYSHNQEMWKSRQASIRFQKLTWPVHGQATTSLSIASNRKIQVRSFQFFSFLWKNRSLFGKWFSLAPLITCSFERCMTFCMAGRPDLEKTRLEQKTGDQDSYSVAGLDL